MIDAYLNSQGQVVLTMSGDIAKEFTRDVKNSLEDSLALRYEGRLTTADAILTVYDKVEKEVKKLR